MPLTLQDIAYGILLPAAAAAVTWLVLQVSLRFSATRRLPAAAALIVGFLTGYGMLHLGPWQPDAARDWLPYAVLLAAPVAALPFNHQLVRGLLTAVVSGVAAWWLVPDWAEPSPLICGAVWATVITILVVVYEPLETSLAGWILPATLTGITFCGAAVLLLAGILKYFQIAGCGAGALLGLTVTTCLLKRPPRLLPGIMLPWLLLLGGILLLGQQESFSSVPLISYILPAAAPLMLWLGTAGPLSRSRPRTALITQLLLPQLVAVAGVIIAVVAEYGPGTE